MSEPLPVSSSTLRRDLVSAYAASGAKIGSWLLVSALLFRVGESHYALFALARATVGLLNYTTLGIGPAIVRMVAEARAKPTVPTPPHPATARPVLDYASAREVPPALRAYSNGIIVASFLAALALLAVVLYGEFFTRLHRVRLSWTDYPQLVVITLGVGMILRLVSDVPGAIVQASDRISSDNWVIAFSELWWFLLTWSCIGMGKDAGALAAAQAFALSGAIQFVIRWRICVALVGRAMPDFSLVSLQTAKALITFGSLVTIAQLADFLYAPTDFILISALLDPLHDIATYGPAVQIDAGLLVIVTALSSVLLPRAALAHASGDRALLRQYYVRGTLASLALLIAVSLIVWLLSSFIFRIWLGDPMRATQAILPLVLIHTIIGGSSAVGRSILLGMGKVKPFAASVLIAGVANVVLSFIFVKYLHLGLRGIIYGTIIAVVGRCALWMPWYVLRTLRHAGAERSAAPDPSV